MSSAFYDRYSRHLLWLAALSFPFFAVTAESIPSNNDLETWLPTDSAVRVNYDEFKAKFGAEEIILIGLESKHTDEELVEAICLRMESLTEIRTCWSPDRLRSTMSEFGVPDDEINEHLQGLSVSDDDSLIGLIALLSADGLTNRIKTVNAVRKQLRYCQIEDEECHLAGAPVVVAELDRLGNNDKNRQFFLITLAICFILIYGLLREWKLSLAIFGLTIWALNVTTAIICLAGAEMNFILGALPVMVMVFTLAIVVHFLHYYASANSRDDAVRIALKQAWRPCCLATLTTTIGLVSLTVSDFGPVCQFGYAASVGCVVALLTGLGLMPAVLTLWPPKDLSLQIKNDWFGNFSGRLLSRSRRVVTVTTLLLVLTSIGWLQLNSKIDPLDFLPKDGRVLTDVRRIQKDLTNTDSIEAVVDFGKDDISFVEKLDRVRAIEASIQDHPAVDHTLSLASFFPSQLPENPLETASLLSRAQERHRDNDFVSEGQRYWRISARVDAAVGTSQQQVLEELAARTTSHPVSFTGIAPLLECAQREIFRGFRESFALAFGIITLVMIASLRSWKAGLIAMIPNLTPICIVFGTMGWIGVPVDIGMMMCGSIALGIAVDGTFHFLVRYQQHFNRNSNSQSAACEALLKTGPPILQATIIASAGMLALTLSSFGPTARFGFLMATMLGAALVGDLVLLPCLLYMRPSSRAPSHLRPHIATLDRQGRKSVRRRRGKLKPPIS